MIVNQEIRRMRGRPRLFDEDRALDAVVKIFWQKGFEGTSLTDLTTATGMNRPSLYATFGDKASLYKKALDRYVRGPASYLQLAMCADTAHDAIERMFRGAIDLLTDANNPSICMMTQGLLACGDESEPVRQHVIGRRRISEIMLRHRLDRAVSDGELSPQTDTAALALYFSTVLRGLGISALGGANREELNVTAQLALTVMPPTLTASDAESLSSRVA